MVNVKRGLQVLSKISKKLILQNFNTSLKLICNLRDAQQVVPLTHRWFSELPSDQSLNHKILVNAERDWKMNLNQLPPFSKQENGDSILYNLQEKVHHLNHVADIQLNFSYLYYIPASNFG